MSTLQYDLEKLRYEIRQLVFLIVKKFQPLVEWLNGILKSNKQPKPE